MRHETPLPTDSARWCPGAGVSWPGAAATRTVACGLVVAGCSCLAAPAFGAGGQFTPVLTVGSYFEDRRTPVDVPFRSRRVTLIPEVGYLAGDEGTLVRFYARRRFTVDPRDPLHADAFSSGNTTDHAALSGRRTWSDLHGASIAAGLSRSPDLIDDPGRLVGVPGAQTRWYAGGRVSRWRLEGGYRAEAWRGYLDVNRHNGLRLTWDASFLPIHRRDTALLFGWRQMQIQLGPYTGVRSRMVVAGYRRALSPLLSGLIEVGASDVELGDGSRWRGPAVVLGARGPRFDEGYASGTVTLQPGLPASAQARVNRPFRGGRVDLRWESALTGEAAIGFQPNLTRQFVLGGEDTLSVANVLGGEVGYGWARPLRSPGPTWTVLRLTGWLERRMRPWLSARAGASFLDFRTTEAGRPSPVRRLRIEAQVAVHP